MAEALKNNPKPSLRRRRTGLVTSAGADKTIRVSIQNLVKHKMYGKYLRRRTKVAVHDPENVAAVGDTVEVVPCRRISKMKNWRLLRVVRTAKLAPADRQAGRAEL